LLVEHNFNTTCEKKNAPAAQRLCVLVATSASGPQETRLSSDKLRH
jgi:hypothetical protein